MAIKTNGFSSTMLAVGKDQNPAGVARILRLCDTSPVRTLQPLLISIKLRAF
jgi:hypothetical protein